MTKRFLGFSAWFLIVLFAACILPAEAAGKKYIMYVGTYTDNGSHGIYAYRFNPKNGTATPLGLAAETKEPSFLAIDGKSQFLYAVNELKTYQGESAGAVSAFAVDRKTGKLRFLNQRSSRGADPAYITLDETGKYVLVANYTGGSVIVYPRLEDGSLAEASSFVQHHGKGVIPQRQDSPHAHEIVPTADDRFALVADLALDKIIVYRFDATKGTLTADDADTVSVNPATGPRHLVFSHDGNFVYVFQEMESSVRVFAFDKTTGKLQPVQKISTLPTDYKGGSDGAEIELHPSGKFLYASNRGHDSIAVYTVDQKNGTLTLLQIVSTQGKIPRNFSVDPTGKWLFAANQKSDDIVLFKIDPKTGAITPTDHVLQVSSPVCVKFAAAK